METYFRVLEMLFSTTAQHGRFNAIRLDYHACNGVDSGSLRCGISIR
jgi:hypothetical protein